MNCYTTERYILTTDQQPMLMLPPGTVADGTLHEKHDNWVKNEKVAQPKLNTDWRT